MFPPLKQEEIDLLKSELYQATRIVYFWDAEDLKGLAPEALDKAKADILRLSSILMVVDK